ncbi:MAG: SIMPL domain-containing protein [Gemmatimonadota bacterium]
MPCRSVASGVAGCRGHSPQPVPHRHACLRVGRGHPDRATITVAVETREKSAAGAGALNARIQTAVLDSLKRIGIAEAVAQAAGGRIAGVIEIVVNPGNQAPEPPMVAMTMARGMEADAPTPIEAGTSKITVSVEARFRFEATGSR